MTQPFDDPADETIQDEAIRDESVRDEAVEVVELPDAGRYEARIGGRRVGVADYHVSDGRVVFPHTEVDPRFGGRGIASQLARRALDDARERGQRVVPVCSFFRVYLDRHPEDADLLA